jgi:hypothetical protein
MISFGFLAPPAHKPSYIFLRFPSTLIFANFQNLPASGGFFDLAEDFVAAENEPEIHVAFDPLFHHHPSSPNTPCRANVFLRRRMITPVMTCWLNPTVFSLAPSDSIELTQLFWIRSRKPTRDQLFSWFFL